MHSRWTLIIIQFINYLSSIKVPIVMINRELGLQKRSIYKPLDLGIN
jgi:hypothetical protein